MRTRIPAIRGSGGGGGFDPAEKGGGVDPRYILHPGYNAGRIHGPRGLRYNGAPLYF